jgi:hypothetical protein
LPFGVFCIGHFASFANASKRIRNSYVRFHR